MIIKELNSDDFLYYRSSILELLIDIYNENFCCAKDQINTICREKLHLLNGYIKDESAIVFAALEDKRLIGFIWLYKHNVFNDIRLHINQVAVCNQFRCKGIGNQLMLEAEKRALALGVNTIELYVSEKNLKALNMYIKMGYITERRLMKKIISKKTNDFDN